jgi:hypothetical protein
MTADTVGGVWTYCLELTRALEKSGIEVGLATMGAPLSRQQAEEALQISNLQLFESSFKLEWMNDPREDVRLSGEWLLGLEEDFHPEVVHLNGYAHGRLLGVLPRSSSATPAFFPGGNIMAERAGRKFAPFPTRSKGWPEGMSKSTGSFCMAHRRANK